MKMKFYNKIPMGLFSDKALLIGFIILVSTFSFTLGYIVGKSQVSEELVSEEKMEVYTPMESKAEEEIPALAEPESIKTEEPKIFDSKTVEQEEIVSEIPKVVTEVPKTEQKEKSIEKKEKKITKRVYYTIQVGAFRISSEAEALKRRLQKKGYTVRIVETGGDKKFYRVRVGKFKSRAEAENMAIKITRNEGLKAIVLTESST
jgi:cell division protein FtsN